MGQSPVKLESAPARQERSGTAPSKFSTKPTGDVLEAADRGPNGVPEKVNFWRFIWPFMKDYRWSVLAALLLNAAHGISFAFQTIAPAYLIDDIILAKGIAMQQRIHRLVVLLTLYMVASVFGRMLVWHMGYRIFTYVREKVLLNIRATFFRHVNHLCLRFHRQHHSGEIFSYLFGSPLTQMQNYFQQFTIGAPGQLFIVVSTLVWVARWDWLLTLVLLFAVTCTAYLMQRTRVKIQKLHSEYQKTETKVSGYVADLLRGSRDVKLYVMEAKVAEDFDSRAWEVGQKGYQRDVNAHVQWMKHETVGYFCFCLL
jgi:ABC-type bacteriocin/lantibiotic exporter with double-glycine peptidase domain